MSETLLIAPEWLGLSGLWRIDAQGRRKAVDAEDLGLSEELADRLEAWMDGFDAIYDEANEAASDFASAAERQGWEVEGLAIAQAVAAELGAGWQVSHDLTSWRGKAKP